MIKKYLENLQYIIILSIAITLPYWSLYSIVTKLSVVLFITTILLAKFNLAKIFINKIFLTLSIFILFTFASALWSEVSMENNMEYVLNILRFKYYFLLIPGLYFSSLNIIQIKKIFLVSALAPIGISLLYYSNYFGFTHIYSVMIGGDSNFFMHYLICNFFILSSSIYFCLSTIEAIKAKNFQKASISFFMSIFFTLSLIIDSQTTARLMVIIFLIILTIIPLLYLKKRNALILIAFVFISNSVFILNSQKIISGYNKTILAINNDKYTGSWGHRLGFAIVGLKIFKENPIIGRGISDVRARTIEFAKDNPKYFIDDPNRHFHNEHINILVEVGIVGYVLFLFFIYSLIKLKIKNILFNNFKNLFVISFLLLMLGEHYLSILNTSLYFAFFIGLIILYKKQEDSNAI